MNSAGSILDYSGWSVKFTFFHAESRLRMSADSFTIHPYAFTCSDPRLSTPAHSANSVTVGHYIVTFLTSSVNNMDIPLCGLVLQRYARRPRICKNSKSLLCIGLYGVRTPVDARYLLYTYPDRPRDPHNLLHNGNRILPGDKAEGG